MGESSSLFMSAALWDELGGLDERFDLPGGGLVNHDLYRRACGLAGVELLELLGEGTFHQYHGGAATSRRFGWDEMHTQYEAIRGERYRPPTNDPLYVGHVHPAVLPFVESSARTRGRTSRSRGEAGGPSLTSFDSLVEVPPVPSSTSGSMMGPSDNPTIPGADGGNGEVARQLEAERAAARHWREHSDIQAQHLREHPSSHLREGRAAARAHGRADIGPAAPGGPSGGQDGRAGAALSGVRGLSADAIRPTAPHRSSARAARRSSQRWSRGSP